uniref:Uncharacterized protein n=1 Tax=Tetranychus urticae TaxID=32264 RepID=T1KAZ0_TETUR
MLSYLSKQKNLPTTNYKNSTNQSVYKHQ